jgi:glycosyltransferase involved in cell wall biosynthesis
MGLGIKNTVASLVSWFKPDIIHSHTATPDGYIGLRLKKKYKLPLVVSLRGSDVNVYPYGDDLTFHLTKKVITESSKITAVSHALKKQAMKVSGARKDIDVVYTGCDLKRFCFNKEARMSVRKRLGIAEGSSVLIFVGQLQRTKGIYELIEAFKLVHDNYPELHLICVGNGIDAKPITAIVENTGIKKYVHLVGHRPPNEIPNWLSASDILVLPSWYEGLPNVVVEAMACSRPVIATCVGGVPEAVEDGKNGILIKRGDIKALAIAIEDLVGDPERCTDMGNVGRLITEKKFTWEKNAAEMAKIYYRALNEI